MKKISWRGWIVTYLTKILFWKFARQYKNMHKQRIPVIIVSGTVGKSSQTAVLAQIFTDAGYNVFTGAGKAQSLNSITGLSIVLTKMDIKFEGAWKYLAGLQFVLKTFAAIAFKHWDLPQKSIVIYEAGIDSVNEAELFDITFAPVQPILVVTSVTAEHTGGFERAFDPAEIVRLGGRLPAEFLHIFTKKDISDTEKNVALDQVKIHTNPLAVILPTSISTITNQYVQTLNRLDAVRNVETKRTNQFALLVAKKFATNPEYLLPETFAKTIDIAVLIAKHFNISDNQIEQSVLNTAWPRGRFGLFAGQNSSTIVDSTYNADPASMTGFFALLEEVIVSYDRAILAYQRSEEDKHLYRPGSHLRKKVQPVVPPKHNLVLGEMRELGSDSANYHRTVLLELITLARKHPDFIENVYLVGKEWKKVDEDLMPKSEQGMYFIHVEKQLLKGFDAVKHLTPLLDKNSIRPNSWWWVKGSQNTIFLEAVVEHLLEDKNDSQFLCRRGEGWDTVRAEFISN